MKHVIMQLIANYEKNKKVYERISRIWSGQEWQRAFKNEKKTTQLSRKPSTIGDRFEESGPEGLRRTGSKVTLRILDFILNATRNFTPYQMITHLLKFN